MSGYDSTRYVFFVEIASMGKDSYCRLQRQTYTKEVGAKTQ